MNYIKICLSLALLLTLPACSSMTKTGNFIFGKAPPLLSTLTPFPTMKVPSGDKTLVSGGEALNGDNAAYTGEQLRALQANSDIELLNIQVDKYNTLIGSTNDLINGLNGRERSTSLFSLGSDTFIGVAGIATAALTASAPAANAVWVQGLNASNTATRSLRSTYAQQLGAAAMTQSLQLTAKDIIKQLNKFQFFEAYDFAVNGDAGQFAKSYRTNQKALASLEQAIVLKPLTQRVEVTNKPAPEGEAGMSENP